MTFISYAQNFEDVMLWRALKHVEKGFYIDVGANDPVLDSVTLAFYERGWRGVNVEPMRQYFGQLCEKRPEDINLPVAVGDAKGELRFFDIPDTGLSTMDPKIAHDHREAGRTVNEETVPVVTLSDLCAEHVRGPIHFLKIDVEGLEGAVLRGMDFQRWHPWILVVEATRPQTQVTNHGEWEQLVLDAGYRFVYFDGLNHYYVAVDHPELVDAFRIPPNVFDDFNLRLGHAFSYPLTEFQVRIHDAELNAYQADVRTQRAHAQRDELELKLREAEQKIVEQRARAELADIRTAQAEASEALMRAELARIYSSTSWRVSAPVRWFGRALQTWKAWGRLALSSPRSFAKRAALGVMRRIVTMARSNPVPIRIAAVLRTRYPDAWQRVMGRLRPAMATLSASPPPPETATPLPGWAGTQHSPFKTMLMREMQRRQDKKNGNS